MDWYIQKSRGCVLLLPTLTLSLLPTLALSLLGTLTSTSPSTSTSTSHFHNSTIPPLPYTTITPFSLTATPPLPKMSSPPLPKSTSPPLPKTSPSPLPKTSLPPLPKTSSPPFPKVSLSPLPKTSSPPLSKTPLSPLRKTSSPPLPKTSLPPLPKTSLPPLPKTSSPPLPKTSSPPFPKTSLSPLPKTSSPPLPKTSSPPLRKTSSPPLSKTSLPPPPKTSLSLLPKTSLPPLQKTSSPPLRKTSSPPLPKTSLSPLPKTSPPPLPKTSLSPLPKTSSPPLPKTSSPLPPITSLSPLPKTSLPPLPKTSSSPPLPKTSPSPLPTTKPSPPTTTSPQPFSTTSPTAIPSTSPRPLPKTTPPRPLSKTPPPKPSPRPLPHTSPPLFDRQPFIVSWNIPNLVCNRYNVTLDTSPFKGVTTPAKVPGQFLSLFYTDRLGLYPHVDLVAKQQFYGGIPQKGNLRASLAKARADINYYIPSRTSRGLAVIDWEEWRPLWDRNWGSKRIYKTLSVALARVRDRSLTPRQAVAKAKHQFQAAARSYMEETLALGNRLRPNYLWGFYLFPNCYNYGWLEPGYTGRCSKEVRGLNDQLLWLWQASTALYPSIYLQASLGNSRSAALLVRNRVYEALRVSALPDKPATAPVFVYTRPVFIDQNRRFLSQGDLVSTIGESASVGASGAVLWGASADYDDKASCEALSSYLTATLNPYIANVTAAAQLCSDFLCQGNGRCVRKRYDSDHYLHLSSGNFRILRARGRYLALGRPTLADLSFFSRRFTCQCYVGLTCAPKLPRHLSKALVFRLKHGLSKKTKTLNKMIIDMEQSSSIKEKNRKQ